MSKSIADMIAREPVQLLPIESLVPYEKNAKKHPKEQIAKIAASIREFGWRGNPIEATEDLTIINGHGRRLAALELGFKSVPVVVVKGLSDEQIRAYRLANNEVAKSDYDTELLAAELADLTMEFDIDMGDFFEARDLQFALDDLGEINLDAVSDNIGVQVAEQSEATQDGIEAEDGKLFSLAKVVGFSKVNAKQQRMIVKLLKFAEVSTGETGAEALAQYAADFVGLQP